MAVSVLYRSIRFDEMFLHMYIVCIHSYVIDLYRLYIICLSLKQIRIHVYRCVSAIMYDSIHLYTNYIHLYTITTHLYTFNI